MAYLLIPLRRIDAAPAAPQYAWTPAPAPAAAGSIAAWPDPLADWMRVATASADACLVVDERGRVAAVSAPAAELLGEHADRMVGRDLLEEVLDVVDFTDEGGPGEHYAERIPPLLSVSRNVLTRGLLRVRRPDGQRLTLDAVAAPVHGRSGSAVVGSVTFLATI
ncbi:MAG: PAS domain-containing protein [Actinomycetota bacterium]|nr:PAS domain-containing protein [Actinomycetota bacterium]